MATETQNKMTALIISSNPEALIAAVALQRSGYFVTIVDSGDNFQLQKNRQYAQNVLPAHDEMIGALGTLNGLFPELQNAQLTEEPTLSFDKERKISFIGFGSLAHESISQLSYFNSAKKWVLDGAWDQFLANLFTQFGGKILSFNEVTKISLLPNHAAGFTDAPSKTPQRAQVTLNENQTETADIIVYMDAPKQLLEILPKDTLGARSRAKFGKTATFQKLTLQMFHKNLSADCVGEQYMIVPTAQDQVPFCGSFGLHHNQVSSTWETYLPSELVEEANSTLLQIKGIKRALKKAFSESILSGPEIILVSNAFAGEGGFGRAAKELNEINDLYSNFFMPPATVEIPLGPAGSLMAAAQIIQSVVAKNQPGKTLPTDNALC
jgi:hypothetical protein